MGSQSAEQGPIISREGLLRLVEVVERLRARNDGEDGSSWTTKRVCAPDPGAGEGRPVAGPAGDKPERGGALARGDSGESRDAGGPGATGSDR